MSTARNIYEQEAHNRTETVLLILAFVILLAFIGFSFDMFVIGAPGPGTLAAVAIASVSSLWSYYGGANAVLASTHAQPIQEGDPSTRQLENVVEEMAIAAGLPKPKIYVLPDDDPNAFATGRDPQHSHIAVTRGLLKTVNREELQAVVAHEMSHIRNLDIRVMMIVAALVGSVALLCDWSGRALWYGGARGSSRDDNKGADPLKLAALIIWVVTIILAPLAAQLAALAVSRQREYLADASGAELTRNPLAMASALEKIEAAAAPTRVISRGTAHLCIADPLGREASQKEGFVAELLGTHPPMAKRIAALRAMGFQPQQTQA